MKPIPSIFSVLKNRTFNELALLDNAFGRMRLLVLLASILGSALPANSQIPSFMGGDYKGAGRQLITHGPVLGRITDTSVGVWARTQRTEPFRVYYGLVPGNLDQVSEPVTTRSDKDNTGWIEIKGLEPDTVYHYAVGFKNVVFQQEQMGKFRTLPRGDDSANPKFNPKGLFNFRFAVMGCGRQFGTGYKTAGFQPYSTLMRDWSDKVHFALHAGDFIYENGRKAQPAYWLWKQGLDASKLPEILQIAPTLVGGWENYKIYFQSNNAFARWHAHVPHFWTFDDHEILNNIYGATVPGRVSRTAVWRDIGLKAWYDYVAWSNPVEDRTETRFGKTRLKAGSDVLYDPRARFSGLDLEETQVVHIHWGRPTAGELGDDYFAEGPGDPNSKVYGIVEVLDDHRLRIRPAPEHDSESTYSIGGQNFAKFQVANCEFYILDTRGQRTIPKLNFEPNPGHTLLGPKQKAWVKASMQKSDAEFFFLLGGVPVMIPHIGSDAELGGKTEEGWSGFPDEREEMIQFWDGLDKPVILLNSDLHNAMAINVTENIFEFTCGPITSDNQHTLASEGNRPANGPFDSGGRMAEILWSTFYLEETPRENRINPIFAIFQVNNVFNNKPSGTEDLWIAYPKPQLVVQFYNALTGDLEYAQSILGK